MNSLFTGLYNHFKLTPLTGFYQDIGGRLYLNVAPQESIFPYCVYSIMSDNSNPDFTDEHEEIEVQFDIFTKDHSVVLAGSLLESLKIMFDYCHLTVEGWSHLDFRRMSTHPNNDYAQDPPIIGYSVLYDVLLEKKRN